MKREGESERYSDAALWVEETRRAVPALGGEVAHPRATGSAIQVAVWVFVISFETGSKV